MNGAPRPGAGDVRFEQAPVITRSTVDALLVLALDERTDEPVMLTGTAVAMWDAFAQPRTVRDVATALAGEYGVDPAEVERSIEGPVARLMACGALRVAR